MSREQIVKDAEQTTEQLVKADRPDDIAEFIGNSVIDDNGDVVDLVARAAQVLMLMSDHCEIGKQLKSLFTEYNAGIELRAEGYES